MLLKIGAKKGRCYEIYVDSKLIGLFEVYTIKRLKIKNNCCYSLYEIKKFKLAADIDYAKSKALELLKIKDYSEYELKKKLERYVSKNIAIYTIKKIKELGLIDNEKYAKNLAHKLILEKNKSKKMAILEMKRKGICEEYIKSAIDGLNFSPEQQIENIILKKYSNKIFSSNSKKVIQYLLRIGYSYNNIKNAIENIKNKNI